MQECYIYARVSTKDQEREGFSIPAQLELLRAYAQREGCRIAGEFTESETAGKAGRVQFSAMADSLQKKKSPKVVLVEKTDRLTRNFQDYVLIEKLTVDHDIEFHLVKEGEIISKNGTGHTKLVQGLKVLLAKNYIDNLREETKKGILQKVKQGGWSWQAPIGYKMIKGELVTDSERAPFVQETFALYADGCHSLDSLRDALFERGYFYRASSPKAPKTQLYNILTNPLYKGEVHYQGQVYPGRHEPLVTPFQWSEANRQLGKSQKRKGLKREFLFAHTLTCGACGSSMCGDEKRGGRYVYYRCWRALNGKCDERYISESEIVKTFDGMFERFEFPIDYKVQMKKAYYELKHAKRNTEQEQSGHLEKERRKLNNKLERIYEDYMEGRISENIWSSASDKCKAQLLALDDASARMTKATIDYYDQVEQYLELPEMVRYAWKSGELKEKRELVQILTSNITVKTKKVTVELVSPFDYFYKDIALKEWYPQGNSNPRRLREREVS